MVETGLKLPSRHLFALLILLAALIAGCAGLPGGDGQDQSPLEPGEVSVGEPSPAPPGVAVAPTPTERLTRSPDTGTSTGPTTTDSAVTDTAPGPTAAASSNGAPPEGDSVGEGGAAETEPPPAVCEPTPPDQLGPFYVPGAPERDSVGEGHVLSGVVRSSLDCSPIAGAPVEFWLAGPDGEYDDAHRALVLAGPDGAYRFQSSFPPPYSGRPPHIHIHIAAEGYEPLVTQYYPQTGQVEATFDLVLVPAGGAGSPPAPTPARTAAARFEPTVEEFDVPAGSHPHDVAPAPDGTVWYTAQNSGALGRLDPRTGDTYHIDLGPGSAPHGVIVGPDGAPWITDSGLNAIVRVDPESKEVKVYPLPESHANANLNTATFDAGGVLWFTGQNGVYGRLDPATGRVEAFDAPRGRGPYGIASTPDGTVYYASLAGSHIARIDVEPGSAQVIEPPTAAQGARRVWADSAGRIWVSEWNAGQVAVYDPAQDRWQEWRLPGDRPQPYAVYVDEQAMVWLSDFGANALVRFDPASETFEVVELPSSPANVRQILGRPGEIWGAESGVDKLVVVRTQ